MAGIQTSQITTATDGDLSLNPAGTGKVVLPDLSGSGEVPMAVDTDGNIKPLDEREFDELTAVDPGDHIMVQRGADYYYIDATNLGGLGLADPNPPNDIEWLPSTPSGSGTQADPYVLTPATVYVPGGTATSVESCRIINQKPDSLLLITEIGGQVGSRMDQSAKICDNAGATPFFNFEYVDAPNSASGQDYDGLIRLGNGSIYVKWVVTQVANNTTFGPASAPTASPTSVDFAADDKYGTVSGTWADGAQTLTATNMVFSVNGGALDGTSKSVSDGDTVAIGFVDATVAAAANGGTITGTISGPTYYSEFSMVKDVNPTPFTIRSVSDAATSTEAYTGTDQLRGFNAPTTLTAAGSGANALTGVQVSINGGTRAAASNATLNPGDTVQGYGTTGAAASTTYQGTFTVGTTVATWDVATADGTASITKPTIDSPTNGSVDLVPDVTLVSSAYQGVDNPGPHTASTWEVYEAGAGAAVSSSIVTSDSGNGTPLVLSQTATSGLKNEVVMVDSLTPTVVGDETQASPYTLTTSTITNVATNIQGDYSGSILITGNNYNETDGLTPDRAFNGDRNSFYRLRCRQSAIIGTLTLTFGNVSPSLDPFTFTTLVYKVEGSGKNDVNGVDVFYEFPLTSVKLIYDDLSSTTVSAVADNVTNISTLTNPSPNKVVTSLEFLRVDGTNYENAGIKASFFEFDGLEFISNDTSVLLGFTNPNPDLKYFRPGDVVQRDGSIIGDFASNLTINGSPNGWEYSGTQHPAVNSFDGQTGERSITSPGTGKELKFTLPDPIRFYDKIRLYKHHNMDYQETYYVNDAVNTSIKSQMQSLHPSGGWIEVPNTNGAAGTLLESLKIILTTNVGTAYWWSVTEVDGNVLYDSSLDPNSAPGTAVSVVSTKPNDNKMTVDGGEWLGSDGSGTAGADTTVEYGPITAKGEVAATNDTSVTLTNVSGRWIGSGSENAAGTTFYAATVAQDGAPGAPSDPVDTNIYTAITPSATGLLSATLNGTNLTEEKFYYSRVKYADDSSTGSLIESDFSDWHEFATADQFAPPVGTQMEGGYYVGQVLGSGLTSGGGLDDAGVLYNLIVAPAASGQQQSIQFCIVAWTGGNAYDQRAFGKPAQDSNAYKDGDETVIYPLFTWADGLNINGYDDWYVPAMDELEMLYRYLKPTADGNDPSSGVNNTAVPPTGVYTNTDPDQSNTPDIFKQGGSEALALPHHWSSNNYGGSAASAQCQRMTDGKQSYSGDFFSAGKTGLASSRVVRRSRA